MLRFALVLAALLVSPPALSARTWHINADGTGDAPTIQAAMDSVSAGDSVLVAPGTYPGDIDLVSGVSIVGSAGSHATIIDATSTGICLDGGDPWSRSYQSPLADVLVQGLTLTGIRQTGYGNSGCCALQAVGDVELRDCRVIDNDSARSPQINFRGDLTVIGCEIARNRAGWDVPFTGGIEFNGGGTGTLRVLDSTIEDCESPAIWVQDGGLHLADSVLRGNGHAAIELGHWLIPANLSATIERNLFIDNHNAIVVHLDDNQGIAILHNTFVGGEYALGPFLGMDPLIHGNLFSGAERDGLILCNACTNPELTCNNSWGNGRANWYNFADPTGTGGNISEAPQFCDFPGGVYTVSENSPCLPANNSCGIQIGAFGKGCGPISVTPESWARVKARYR
ncbi:MAG: hypothetical protein DHS20C21_07720 [Gemmatimonadota bacterium]|nr:MAG: hypothetical protein DHS20C21_07720 [Gemmatimonadota bacterium]